MKFGWSYKIKVSSAVYCIRKWINSFRIKIIMELVWCHCFIVFDNLMKLTLTQHILSNMDIISYLQTKSVSFWNALTFCLAAAFLSVGLFATIFKESQLFGEVTSVVTKFICYILYQKEKFLWNKDAILSESLKQCFWPYYRPYRSCWFSHLEKVVVAWTRSFLVQLCFEPEFWMGCILHS